jgi:phage antirepressor YoqD-like protein
MSNGIVTLEQKPIPSDALAMADMMERAVTVIRQQHTKIVELETEVDTLTPYVDAYMDFVDTDTETTVREVAQLLAIPNMGQNNMFKYMRQIKMIDIDNMPYQTHVDAKHLRRIYNGLKPDGTASFKTVFLTKGIDYIRKKLIEDGIFKPSTQHDLT